MGEDGFVTVTKKGRNKKHKNRQTSTTIISSLKNTETREKIDVSKSLVKINVAVTEIETSKLFEELKESLSSIGKIASIRCYGLGHIGECITARYQLGLLISLSKLFGLSKTQVVVFDPIFFNEEVEILSLLNFTVSSTNTECKDRVVRNETMDKTLFFLPHCPKQMTNNLLWTNWKPEYLSSCVLLSNSFGSVVERTTSNILNEEAMFINAVVVEEIVIEKVVSNSFKYADIFNDLALHTFSVTGDSLTDKLWDLPAPNYKESDTEFIRAKIAISH